MDDDDDPQLYSPPAKTQKRQPNRSGKRYQINLGYGDHAKRLWDQFDEYKKGLGYETMADAAEWILELIGPLVAKQESIIITDNCTYDGTRGRCSLLLPKISNPLPMADKSNVSNSSRDGISNLRRAILLDCTVDCCQRNVNLPLWWRGDCVHVITCRSIPCAHVRIELNCNLFLAFLLLAQSIHFNFTIGDEIFHSFELYC